jgi:hypothetical protein
MVTGCSQDPGLEEHALLWFHIAFLTSRTIDKCARGSDRVSARVILNLSTTCNAHYALRNDYSRILTY